MSLRLPVFFLLEEAQELFVVVVLYKEPELHVANSLLFVLQTCDAMLCHEVLGLEDRRLRHAHQRRHQLRQIDRVEAFAFKSLESLNRHVLNQNRSVL